MKRSLMVRKSSAFSQLIATIALSCIIGAFLTLSAHGQDEPSAQVKRNELFNSWLPNFHQAWSSDSCVQQSQGWDDYYNWVKTFYYQSGGWFETSDALTARVTDAAARSKISADLSTLGRRVAAEWSKDNSCRRIDTFGPNGIQNFGAELAHAASQETGDGSALKAGIATVKAQVDALLAAH